MYYLKTLFILSLSLFSISCAPEGEENSSAQPDSHIDIPKENLQEDSVEALYSVSPESGVVTLYFYDPEKCSFNFLTKTYSSSLGNLDNPLALSRAHVTHSEPFGNTLWFSTQNQNVVGSRGRQINYEPIGFRFFKGKVYRKKALDEPAFVDEEMRDLNQSVNPSENSHHFQFGPGPNQRWLIRIVEQDRPGVSSDFLMGIKILEVIGGQSVTFRWFKLGGENVQK